MFRGIGEGEKQAIEKTGYVQSKGKGNDDDKGTHTCFSNRFQQAEGYARSQYDLYDQPSAYVMVLPKPPWVTEDEHGELVAHAPVPATFAVYMPIGRELQKSFDEAKHPRQKDGKFGTKDTSEEGKLTIFHGTALVNADKIKEKGFKAQWSGNGDLGKCAYFKSPAWDKHETDDFGSSENVVNRFAEGIKEEQDGCVIKAQIDAKHVLDCSKGRPQELQDMIDALKPKGARGKATPKWDKKSSPYEAYAKKHGIKVIVDKLDTGWEDEGYQIGVYDPKIIQILEVGKSLKGGELQKALATGELPYCLLHHEFDKDGNLILHIGATSEA
jgi:hypothetical protein